MPDDPNLISGLFTRLRQEAGATERERKRSERWGRLVSTALLGLTSLIFVTGLTLVATVFGPLFGLPVPLDRMGLLGQVAASIAPTPDPSRAQPGGSIAGGEDQPATLSLPTAIPSTTSTPTLSPTPTVTLTATPQFSDTPRPSLTPIPSRTPRPSPDPSEAGSLPASPTRTPTASGPAYPGCDPGDDPGLRAELLDRINAERDSQGLPDYQQNSRLRDAARAHSLDMACTGLFSHTGSDGSSVGDRVHAEGYDWGAVGESIYGTVNTTSEAAQLALDWWMASPPNRANLLSEEFVEIGIGYAYSPDSPLGGYFTVVFARP